MRESRDLGERVSAGVRLGWKVGDKPKGGQLGVSGRGEGKAS